MYTNADCLVHKVEYLKLLVNSLDVKPNIIAITEVKSKHKQVQTKMSEFNLCGYNIICNDLESESKSRGIIVYLDNKIDYSIIECKTKFKETLVVKINTSTKNELYLCVNYRSPNSTDNNNQLLLQYIVEMCERKLDNLVFIGDFNLPGIDWNTWYSSSNNQFETDFINILRDFYLLQHVSFPTRTRGSDTPHILDLVMTLPSKI